MKIDKIKVNSMYGNLDPNKWVYEVSQPLSRDTSAESVLKELYDELKREQAFTVEARKLADQGWIKLQFHEPVDEQWCKENIHGNYKKYGGSWVFQDKDDAAFFILTWAAHGEITSW